MPKREQVEGHPQPQYREQEGDYRSKGQGAELKSLTLLESSYRATVLDGSTYVDHHPENDECYADPD